MANRHLPDPDVANPFVLGDIILDGDEDSQVVVWEDGAPTWWALQFPKWRKYFNVSDRHSASAASTLVLHEETPSEDVSTQEATSPPADLDTDQSKKRTSEEAGLELN